MATWPTTLPSQFEVGAQLTAQDGVIRSPVDTGPSKRRNRFTATSRFYRGTLLLTKAQKDALETFYLTTVNKTDAFDFEDPADFSTVQAAFLARPTYQLLVGGPNGVEQHRATIAVELLP